MYHFECGDFAKTVAPTPVLNSPDFQKLFGGEDGISLPLDEQGLFRPLETIFLPETKVKITGRSSRGIYSIVSSEYIAGKLFIDARFLENARDTTPERIIRTPKAEKLLERLESLLGLPYVWGGNYSKGIPEMLEFYPPARPIASHIEAIWAMKGVDCSGLLYEITDGATPRNTSQLINYGQAVKIIDKEIILQLKPLDLIVWKGHMIIVLDPNTAIESRAGVGVVKTCLQDRLAEVMQTKTPADSWDNPNDFVIRRWHPEMRSL